MIVLLSLLMTIPINHKVLFDFAETSQPGKWQVVNDGVMGGMSRSSFTVGENGTASFSGKVSLENNGGFCSVHYKTGEIDVGGYTTLALYLKGDGKNYQVRIREKTGDYYSYIITFQTSGKWETIKIPLNKMYPSFRGRKLDLPDFNGKTMVELTFLISNKKAESFTLELQKAFLE